MRSLSLVEAVTDALRVEMEADPTVLVFGEDVGGKGGVFRANASLQERFGEARCFDTPLSEGGIVGAAIGMAVGGLKPVVEIQFSGFTYSAFNQLANHAARLRNRSRGSLTVPMVLRTPHGGGIRAPEHHSECMEALFAHMRGLKVVIPSTPYDAKGLLIAAIRDPDPVVFLEPARIYRSVRQEVPEEAYAIQIGKARVEVEGNELTLVSYGAQMKEAREAVQLLAGRGHAVELIDLRTIYPLDAEALTASVRKTGRLLVVHEAHESFGAAAEVIAAAVEGAFESLQAPPARLTGPETFIPLARGEHHYLIRSEHIVAEAEKVMSYEP